MRARQRHWNTVSAGAVSSLDGRFLSGLNNNDTMSEWTPRSGSTLTPAQATSGNRPQYRTSSINSLPGVYFDDGGTASSGKFFTVDTSVTTNNVSCVFVANKTANNSRSTYSRICLLWNSANSAQSIGDFGSTNSITVATFGYGAYGGVVPNAINVFRNTTAPVQRPYTTNTSTVGTTLLNGDLIELSTNGSVTTGTTSTTSLNSNRFRIGAAPALVDGNMLGHIAHVSIFYTSLSRSLLRRCERSIALAFKIACS